jgi:hypothetical protein
MQKEHLNPKKLQLVLKTFGSFNEILEVKPKTPLPSVNSANAVEIAVS